MCYLAKLRLYGLIDHIYITFFCEAFWLYIRYIRNLFNGHKLILRYFSKKQRFFSKKRVIKSKPWGRRDHCVSSRYATKLHCRNLISVKIYFMKYWLCKQPHSELFRSLPSVSVDTKYIQSWLTILKMTEV